jgi:uncharacterized protein (DUF433 family)
VDADRHELLRALEVRDAAIVAARREGASCQELADRYDLTRVRIWQILKAKGAPGDTMRRRRRLAA